MVERERIPHEDLVRFAQELTAKGKLLEAGWLGFRLAVVPPDAPPIQLDEMRMAFFGGAQHLLTSIMTMLDPGAEETDADLERMNQIQAELAAFEHEFAQRHGLRPRSHG